MRTHVLALALVAAMVASSASAAVLAVDFQRTAYEGTWPAQPALISNQELGGGYGNDSYRARAFSAETPFASNIGETEAAMYGGVRGEALHVAQSFNTWSMLDMRWQTDQTTTYFSGTEDQVTVQRQGRVRSLFVWDAVSEGLAFDDESSLAISVARWDHMGTGRWVVRDGDIYYVSEATFSGTSTLSGENLLATQWAELDPVAFTSGFDYTIEGFAPHSFSDLNQFGFLSDKVTFTAVRHWLTVNSFQALVIPEPATMGLLGLGALGLLRRRRR